MAGTRSVMTIIRFERVIVLRLNGEKEDVAPY